MKSLVLVFELSLLTLLLLALEAESASECKTTDGRKCVFPFKFTPLISDFEERTYNECTWDYAFHPMRNRKAWCGTSKKTGQISHWGSCGEGCPIPGRKHSLTIDIQILIFSFTSFSTEFTATCNNNNTGGRRKCVFPFTYDGKEYHECTWDWAFHKKRRNIGRAWCGTRADPDDYEGWGDCGEGCPIPGRKQSHHRDLRILC